MINYKYEELVPARAQWIRAERKEARCGLASAGRSALRITLMDRLSGEDKEKALLTVARLCVLRGKDDLSEDLIAQQLGFVDETDAPLREAMYERLEGWELPGWIVYPDGGGEQIGKETTKRNLKKRNVQSFGRDKEELPPAEQAEPLFRNDLERLRRYVNQLQGLRERYQEKPQRWLSYRWIEGDWESFDRRDFSEDEWRQLCEEADVDPAWEYFVAELKPSDSPVAVGDAPWEGLVYLIAMHMLMNGSIDRLLDELHPKPDKRKREELRQRLYKKKHGTVTTLRASAKELAKLVRGGKGGAGAPAPGLSPWEMKVAWEMIHPLAQEGLSYKDILEKLKEDGSVDLMMYSLGYELTVSDVERLNKLPRPPS
jgi:hypothetical protein